MGLRGAGCLFFALSYLGEPSAGGEGAQPRQEVSATPGAAQRRAAGLGGGGGAVKEDAIRGLGGLGQHVEGADDAILHYTEMTRDGDDVGCAH